MDNQDHGETPEQSVLAEETINMLDLYVQKFHSQYTIKASDQKKLTEEVLKIFETLKDKFDTLLQDTKLKVLDRIGAYSMLNDWEETKERLHDLRQRALQEQDPSITAEYKDFKDLYDLIQSLANSNPQINIKALEDFVENIKTEYGFLTTSLFGVESYPSLDLEKINTETFSTSHNGIWKAMTSLEKYEIFATGGKEGMISLWGMNTFENIDTIQAFSGQVLALTYFPSYDYLVAAGDDPNIFVFKLEYGRFAEKPITMYRHTKWVKFLLPIEEEGLLVSAGNDPCLNIWRMKDLEIYTTITTGGKKHMRGELFYIKKEQLIGIGFKDGMIHLFHLKNRKCVMTINTGFHLLDSYGMYLMENELYQNFLYVHTEQGKIKVWKIEQHHAIYDRELSYAENGKALGSILAVPKDGLLLACSMDKHLRILHFRTGETLKEVELTVPAENLLFLKKNSKILVSSMDTGKIGVVIYI